MTCWYVRYRGKMEGDRLNLASDVTWRPSISTRPLYNLTPLSRLVSIFEKFRQSRRTFGRGTESKQHSNFAAGSCNRCVSHVNSRMEPAVHSGLCTM